MQIYADVTRRPLHLIDSEQGPALGSAMHAAVAAGAHPDIHAAAGGDGQASAATPTCPTRRAPTPTTRSTSTTRRLHDHFGRGGDDVMHALRRIRAARGRPWLTSSPSCAARSARCTRSCRATGSCVDERQPLGARPRRGADGHQGQRRPLRRADARRDRRLRPRRRASSRATLAPSSDAATHGYVYRHMPDVGGVAHTHSAYATAWAARGEAIPCVLTAMADEFGGEIPIGPFALIGDEEIGRGVVETLAGHRSPAVLHAQPRRVHPRPRPARRDQGRGDVRGRRAHRAPRAGARRRRCRSTREDIDALYDRYQNVYGQR